MTGAPLDPIDFGLAARAIAAGFSRQGPDAAARVTLTLEPTSRSTPAALARWPQVMRSVFGEGRMGRDHGRTHRLLVAPASAVCPMASAKPVSATLAWRPPLCNTMDLVLDLWRRMMTSPGTPLGAQKPWLDLRAALSPQAQKSSDFDVVIPTPHSEASLTLTLERGRSLLDALAGEGSGLGKRGTLRQPPDTSWDPAIASVAEMPKDADEWLAHFERATASVRQKKHGKGLWPRPAKFADAVLSRRTGDFECLVAQVHAAHHQATCISSRRRDDRCAAEDGIVIAQRRLATLLSLPVLQRLVGFAADLEVSPTDLRDAAAGETFVLLSSDADSRCWTLARLDLRGDPPLFVPATKEEMSGPNFEAVDELGLIHLGSYGAHGPRYDLCTVDPALATESDAERRAAQVEAKSLDYAGTEKADAIMQTLRTGGLRLIDRDRLLATCAAKEATKKLKDDAAACLDGHRIIVDCAKTLQTGMRLMVSVRTDKGYVWRSPQHRSIAYIDPEAPAGAYDWVEQELENRFDRDRRLDLDASAIGTLDRYEEVERSEKKPPDAPDVKARIVKLISESSLVAWGGEPMSCPSSELFDPKSLRPGEGDFEIVAPVVHELNITRRFAIPSADGGVPPELLSPTLRFGWSYHVALSRVFAGGGTLTGAEITSILSGRPDMALPALDPTGDGMSGRRFLRHERLHGVMVAFPEAHLAELSSTKPSQHGSAMFVRSSDDFPAARIGATRRLLLPPPVPLNFAALHDVLYSLGPDIAVPPPAVPGLSFPHRCEDADAIKRARVGPLKRGETASLTYYPDPAASLLVLALCVPGASPGRWISDPMIIPVAGEEPWPSIIPVHLELKATSTRGLRPRIVDLGRRWLGPGETLLTKERRGAVAVHAVEVHLERGADVELHTWFVPTSDQLADWFDSVEAAALLATHEGAPSSPAEASSACTRGLAALIDTSLPHVGDEPEACTGVGGLPLPSASRIALLAGLIHQAMLRSPLAPLSGILVARLTHAIGQELVPPPVIADRGVSIARRLFSGGDQHRGDTIAETRLDFINRIRAADWDERHAEEGARSALFGGALKIDLAATEAVEIEVDCAAPSSDKLDDALRGRGEKDRKAGSWPTGAGPGSTGLFGFFVSDDHRVSFKKMRARAVRIDGLPLPDDAASGLRQTNLEDLQATSWGDVDRRAIRTTLFGDLTTAGARHLLVRAVAIGRHGGLMPPAAPKPGTHGKWTEVWLPSTVRPAAPLVDRIEIGITEHRLPRVASSKSIKVGLERTTSLRIWIQRPWFSSGEDERLGLVLWPPALFTRGIGNDDIGQPIREALLDDDLGPGGRFVCRWGADATLGGASLPGALILPQALDLAGTRVPFAYMPTSLESEALAQDHDRSAKTESGIAPASKTMATADGTKNFDQATPRKSAPRFLAVALQTFEPRFDPVEELWYVDLHLRTDPFPMPRVRLGLVRYQPHAREDDQPEEGREPVRLRVSAPVVEWVQPLPGRTVDATLTRRDDSTIEVHVAVRGPSSAQAASSYEQGAAMRIELYRYRSATASAPALEECCLDAGAEPCRWESWSTDDKGATLEVDDGRIWTCLFRVPKAAAANWRLAVVVSEVTRRPSATSNEEAPEIIDGGSTFFGRLEFD